MIKIIELERGSLACPSQWYGYDEYNRPVYIRYRGGHLSILVGDIGEDKYKSVNEEVVYKIQFADIFGGWMSEKELQEATDGVLNIPEDMVKKMTREYEERIENLFENTRKMNEIRFSQHMKEGEK